MKSLAPLTALLRSTTSSPPPSHLLLLHSPTNHHLEPTTLASHSFSTSSFSSSEDPILSRSVKVSVWWDFENCNVPNGVNAVKVSRNIISALRASGIRGPVTITAFGDFLQLSKATMEALSCTGVVLNHVPSGGKNTADRSLLADLVFWVSRNPPPAYIFLISTDKDFANILHRLRMNNYSILLAGNDPVPGVLCSAASIKWTWYDLVKREKFSGKVFNEPPDGIQESWYLHNRGPLDDPFADMKQPTRVQAEESTESVTVPKLRVIPNATVNQIRHIVNSYPKGVDISELRSKLGKNNVSKDLFGYKKFSHLLKSLPTVLKLTSSGDQILAHGIQSKVSKPDGPPKVAERVDVNAKECTKLEANDDDQGSTLTAELSKTEKVVATDVNKTSPLSAYSPPKTDHPPIGPIENDVILTEGHQSQVDQKDSISEVGFYQRARRIIFGNECHASNNRSSNCTEISCTTFGSFERKDHQEKSNESILKENYRMKSEERDKPNPRVGMFSNILKWFKSWKTSESPDDTVGSVDKEMNQMINQMGTNQSFSKASLEDLISILNNSKGASVISQSTAREEPSKLLQKEGPSRASSNPHSTNGISSMSLEKLSPSNLHRPPSYETRDRKKKDTQHGACSNESDKKSLGKSKGEILADCQMLVAEMFKEHPEGFNMGLLKTSFRTRYGYDLEHGKLGYWKLGLLLQTIPGVDISFNFVLPSERSSKIDTPYNSQNDGAVKVSNSDSDDTMSNERTPILETKSKISGIISENSEGIEHKNDGDSQLLEGFSELEEEVPVEDGSDGNLTHNNNDVVTVCNQDSDTIWKEHLPTSKTKSKSNCFRSEITKEKIEEHGFVKFDEHSCLPDKSPELEKDFSEGKASDVETMTSKNEVDSSLLRLLDSYSKKNEPVKKSLDN